MVGVRTGKPSKTCGSLVIAFLTFFAGLIVTKAIIEPIATNLGRAFLEQYLDQCCRLLDFTLDAVGIDFEPEQTIRRYLDLLPEQLSEKQVDQIVEAVFKEWDLRQFARNAQA